MDPEVLAEVYKRLMELRATWKARAKEIDRTASRGWEMGEFDNGQVKALDDVEEDIHLLLNEYHLE